MKLVRIDSPAGAWGLHDIVLVSLAMVVALVAFVMVASPAEAAADRYVSMSGNDGGGANDCLTEASPCLTIQHAIDQAATGDTVVLLDAGVYPNSLGIQVHTGLTLRGQGLGVTTLQAAPTPGTAADRILVVNAASGFVDIEDLTLENGNGDSNGGGAVLINTSVVVTFRNVEFTGNQTAGDGGAIRAASAPGVRVVDSVLTDNAAGGDGGAISLSVFFDLIHSELRDNTAAENGGAVSVTGGGLFVGDGSQLADNTAGASPSGGDGGAIWTDSFVKVTEGSTLSGNVATLGGGIFATGGDTLTIDDGTVIEDGVASEGGGLFIDDALVTIDDAVIANNHGGNGGGIAHWGAAPSTLDITDTAITGNSSSISGGGGGGVRIANNTGPVTITRSLIADNTAESFGAGVEVVGPADLTMTHTALVGHTTGGALYAANTTATVDATLNWWGGASGPLADSNPGGLGDEIIELGTPVLTFDPWLASVDVTTLTPDVVSGDPVEVTATLLDSGSPPADAGVPDLFARFTHTGANPDADEEFSSPAVHSFNATSGTDTVTAAVLFAGVPSTLTGDVDVFASTPGTPDIGSGDPDEELPASVEDSGLTLGVECVATADVTAAAIDLSTPAGCPDVRMTAPSGALPEGNELLLATVADLDELPPFEAGSLALGFVVQLRDADGDAVTDAFAAPATVEVTVEADLVPEDVRELLLAYWDGDAWAEVLATVTENGDGTATLTSDVDHFSVFAVAQQPGRGLFTPAPAASGISLARWGGGPVGLLPDAASFWVTVDGRFTSYVPTAPEFVNANFLRLFPDGIIPAGTVLIVVR